MKESVSNFKKTVIAYIVDKKITDEKEIEHLNYLLTATLNKILHKPFMNLKEHATDNDKYSIAEAMNIIFKNN